MGQKRKGQLTKTGEWAKHLRKDFRRIFWSRERMALKKHIQNELDNAKKKDPPLL